MRFSWANAIRPYVNIDACEERWLFTWASATRPYASVFSVCPLNSPLAVPFSHPAGPVQSAPYVNIDAYD